MGEFAYSKGLKRRILIVDDEEINREILGNMLQDHYVWCLMLRTAGRHWKCCATGP